MTETFLHYVWKHRIFRFTDLKTTENEDLKIIHPGFPHHDAGPDFKQAIIKIGGITWAGDVEIHINSSDWIKHRHQFDPKYQSVALHVVYNFDCEIRRNEKELFPTLELRDYIPKNVLEEYLKLSLSENLLPCKSEVQKLSKLHFSSLLSSMAMERLFEKQQNILGIVRNCAGDWNEAFFRILAINFGFKTNAAAFELLGKSLPYRYISKHSNNRLQIYALIFGQAGMLEEECEDDYYVQLQNEYLYLKYKYKLVPVDKKNWNYLRLRPSNFPCIRLAQLSEIMHHCDDFFQKYLFNQQAVNLNELLSREAHPYWKTHYSFGKSTAEHNVTLGKNTANLIYINSLVPLLFALGTFKGDEKMQEKALELLENVDFEKNNITLLYKKAGFPDDSALYSQAILHLHHHYCLSKKCLNCSIGNYIINPV